MMEEQGDEATPDALRREVERLIVDVLGKRTRKGEPNYFAVGEDLHMSQSALQTIRTGGEPRASTLLRFARHAGVNPLRLYQLAGWLTPDDVLGYVEELYAAGVERLRVDPTALGALLTEIALTGEELEMLATSNAALLDLLRERRIAEARALLAGEGPPGDGPAPAPGGPGGPPDRRAERGGG